METPAHGDHPHSCQLSSPEEISAIIRDIVVEKFSPTKDPGDQPSLVSSWNRKENVIETVSSSDPEPGSSSCEACDTTETSLSSGVVTPTLLSQPTKEIIQTVMTSTDADMATSSVDTSGTSTSGITTPESEPSSSTSSSGSSPIFVGSEVNFKTDHVSVWMRGKIITVNDVNGHSVVIKDKISGTKHIISDTRKNIKSGKHTLESLNRLDTPRHRQDFSAKSKQKVPKYELLDKRNYPMNVVVSKPRSPGPAANEFIKKRNWTKPPPSIQARENCQSLAELASASQGQPNLNIDRRFRFPPPPIVDPSSHRVKIQDETSQTCESEEAEARVEDFTACIHNDSPIDVADQTQEAAALPTVSSIDIDELKNSVISDLELQLAKSRSSSPVGSSSDKSLNKDVDRIHPVPSELLRPRLQIPALTTVDEYYEGNVTKEDSPKARSPCSLPTIEEECLEDGLDKSFQIEDIEIADSFHPGSCSSPEPDPKIFALSSTFPRPKVISVSCLGDVLDVLGVKDKRDILTLLDQTSFQGRFIPHILTLPLMEFTKEKLDCCIVKKAFSVMSQEQLQQVNNKVKDNFLSLASSEEGHTILLSLLSQGDKQNQEELSTVLLDKKIFFGLLKTGTGALVAQRCLAHVNEIKIDDILGEIVEFLMGVLGRVDSMPHQFLGFIDYLISRVGNKEPLNLLLDEIVSETSLSFLAQHPIGHWVLQTVLKTNQDHCLRMIMRWIIKNLGTVLLNISSGALAISVIECLLGRCNKHVQVRNTIFYVADKLNEKSRSVIWSHLLKSLMVKLFEEEETFQIEKSVEESNNVEVVFDKLFEDSIADIPSTRKKPLVVTLAQDSVGHRFVVELTPFFLHLQPFTKVNINALFNDFESDLKKNQFGLIVVKCLKGNM